MDLPGLTFVECERALPLLTLPLRTTIINLRASRLLLSPASTLRPEKIRESGAVTDIIAPNLFHLDGMKAAIAEYPQARVWGPPGAPEKIHDIAWTRILGVDSWPYDDELKLVPIDGMPSVNEHVFYHRESRALLVTDFVFNIERPKGWAAGALLRALGTHRRFAMSRLFLMAVKRRGAFKTSVDALLDLDIEHIVPAHGAIVSRDAMRRLSNALAERGYV